MCTERSKFGGMDASLMALALHLFESLDEIQDFVPGWLWTYNHERPNMGLGDITPKQKLAVAA
jgi:putative transposase